MSCILEQFTIETIDCENHKINLCIICLIWEGLKIKNDITDQ